MLKNFFIINILEKCEFYLISKIIANSIIASSLSSLSTMAVDAKKDFVLLPFLLYWVLP